MTPFPLTSIEDIYEISYNLARHVNLFDKSLDYAEARWYYQRLLKEFEDIKQAREKARNAKGKRR